MEAQLDIKVYIAKYSIFPSGKNLFQITASDEVPDQFLEESKLPNSHRATFVSGTNIAIRVPLVAPTQIHPGMQLRNNT